MLRLLRGSRLLLNRHTANNRLFSTAAASYKRDHVVVPCRSNGSIKIDILHASAPASPVLIYLPSGSVIPEHGEEEERLVTALAASSQSTVARVNYRFSAGHTWPTPLHDVLVGYDWIVQNLLSDHGPRVRVGVCGELVGGSLATTLALTECHGGRGRIVAAAVNNPIADWIFPDDLPVQDPAQLPEPQARPEETSFLADQDMMTWWAQQEEQEEVEMPKSKKRQKRPPKTSAWISNGDNSIIPTLALSGERDVLFSNPEHLFDRFASPIHFFRSPHGQFIKPQDEDIRAHSPSDPVADALDLEAQLDISHYDSANPSDAPPPVPVLARCRAYARIYPQANSLLRLPQWHITSGSQSPLLDQASELARMLKRSIARQALRSQAARVMWQNPEEKEKYEAWADQRVQFGSSEGVGLWTFPDAPDRLDHVETVGQWMSKRLSLDRN